MDEDVELGAKPPAQTLTDRFPGSLKRRVGHTTVNDGQVHPVHVSRPHCITEPWHLQQDELAFLN